MDKASSKCPQCKCESTLKRSNGIVSNDIILFLVPAPFFLASSVALCLLPAEESKDRYVEESESRAYEPPANQSFLVQKHVTRARLEARSDSVQVTNHTPSKAPQPLPHGAYDILLLNLFTCSTGEGFSPVVVSPVRLNPFVYSPVGFSPVVYSPVGFSKLVFSPVGFSPVVYSPVGFSPLVFSPVGFSPVVFSPVLICPSCVQHRNVSAQ